MAGLKGIKFNTYHSYNDLGLILSSKTIGAAEPKTELIEIPGADAPLDFTEFFGDVKYKNRKLSFTFKVLPPAAEFSDKYSNIQNKLNGRKMKIIDDDDPDFWYFGRVSVGDLEKDKNIATISVECDCEPYKYRLNKTTNTVVVTGSKTVELENMRQHVVPLFNSTAQIDIEFEGEHYSISTTGEFTLPEVVLKEGKNTMTISGNATVTISYQEGGL